MIKLCECGCGNPAPISSKTRTKQGHKKGQPTRFIKGHSQRIHRHSLETIQKMKKAQTGEKHHSWKGENVDYSGIHRWVRRHKIKTGKCSLCLKNNIKTDWANISGKYKRDLNDFIEACRSCNMKM